MRADQLLRIVVALGLYRHSIETGHAVMAS
jgi:hypothetical protein